MTTQKQIADRFNTRIGSGRVMDAGQVNAIVYAMAEYPDLKAIIDMEVEVAREFIERGGLGLDRARRLKAITEAV